MFFATYMTGKIKTVKLKSVQKITADVKILVIILTI